MRRNITFSHRMAGLIIVLLAFFLFNGTVSADPAFTFRSINCGVDSVPTTAIEGQQSDNVNPCRMDGSVRVAGTLTVNEIDVDTIEVDDELRIGALTIVPEEGNIVTFGADQPVLMQIIGNLFVGGAQEILGNLLVVGALEVAGAKAFIQPHPNDPSKEISYVSLEGPEAGTYIRGTAQLINGEALIELPEHFGLVTSEDNLTVVLTPLGEWLQLFVSEQSTQRIVVREAQRKSGQFHYVIQGIRRGFEEFEVVRDKKE